MLHFGSRVKPQIRLAVSSTLGSRCVNITAFPLGRRDEKRGAVAVSLVRHDGKVTGSILGAIRGIPAITTARQASNTGMEPFFSRTACGLHHLNASAFGLVFSFFNNL